MPRKSPIRVSCGIGRFGWSPERSRPLRSIAPRSQGAQPEFVPLQAAHGQPVDCLGDASSLRKPSLDRRAEMNAAVQPG